MTTLERDIKRRVEIAKLDAEVRARITRRLARLGVKLDYEGNTIGVEEGEPK